MFCKWSLQDHLVEPESARSVVSSFLWLLIAGTMITIGPIGGECHVDNVLIPFHITDCWTSEGLGLRTTPHLVRSQTTRPADNIFLVTTIHLY